LRIMDLNLKRFLAYYGKIILMPEILMGSNSCIYSPIFSVRLPYLLFNLRFEGTLTLKKKKHRDKHNKVLQFFERQHILTQQQPPSAAAQGKARLTGTQAGITRSMHNIHKNV
jgi:hypothetical protein